MPFAESSIHELNSLLGLAFASVDPQRLWVNPDCGLKTRGYRRSPRSAIS
ncbi:hypothetical protein [Flaviflexus equikiangi]|nr:hypothetical protein [Flaviflexus equikiangi]